MSIFNHLDEFATALSEEEFSPALPERLAVTKQLLASESPSLRSVAAPRYVTDLGVRRSSDAERFYDIHCNLAKITPLSKEQLYTYLSAIPTEHLHFHLDACILMFGAYGACADYITQAQEELLAQGSYTTLLYCGEILAAVSNTNALCFFDRASAMASSQSDAYEAQHRAAAFETKRLGKTQDSHHRLICAKRKYLNGDNNDLDLALLLNLDALNLWDDGIDTSVILESLRIAAEKAKAVFTSSCETQYTISVVLRYYNQICINIAQVFARDKKYDRAVKTLTQCLDNCCAAASEYMPEILGELSYFEYLNQDYLLSIQYANLAFMAFRQIGGIVAMERTRQVAVGSLMRLGHARHAAKIASDIDTDPLGLSWKPELIS